jgi:hypothetical protein
MSRMHRVRRRASHSVVTHDRARGLAAARLGTPLDVAAAAWLDEHLATCEPCRSIAAAYEADRLSLRAMRDRQPVPPRDLWARTAASIERESARGRGRGRRPAADRWSTPALGMLSAVAVIVVVLGATILTGGFSRPPTIALVPIGTPAAVAIASATPGATPIVVGAGNVGWVGTSPDGALAYNVTKVSEVCPADRQPDCAPVAARDSQPVAIDITPKSISQSPIRNQAVVVGTDPSGGDAVVVIALPTSEPSATPSPAIAPSPTQGPTDTPTTSEPPVTPSSSVEPSQTEATPTPVPTPTASAKPSAAPSVSATPTVTPEPTVAAALAIVSNVKVVGESAAYSPDGAWFAFTARPANDSAGPDIYVWHVGDPLARPITTDHTSVFASWAGKVLIGSRPAPAATTSGQISPRSFFVDPLTGVQTLISGTAWRPTVDPTNHWAVTWDGTVTLAPDGLTTVPASGSLVLHGFTPDAGLAAGAPTATLVADGSLAEFDVRWDESGTWLAVWLADASDPSIGRLSLLHLDPATGQLDRPHGAPHDVTALPGFSIGNGRLAWATPPGQGGEGSRVQIVAWTATAVGAVESGPVVDVVVVH